MQICYPGQQDSRDFEVLQRERILSARYAIHCRSCSRVLGKDGLIQDTRTQPWSDAEMKNSPAVQMVVLMGTRPLAQSMYPHPSKLTLTSKAMQGTLLVRSSELVDGVTPFLLLYMETTCNLFHLGQHLDKCGYQKEGYEGATADDVTHDAAFR